MNDLVALALVKTTEHARNDDWHHNEYDDQDRETHQSRLTQGTFDLNAEEREGDNAGQPPHQARQKEVPKANARCADEHIDQCKRRCRHKSHRQHRKKTMMRCAIDEPPESFACELMEGLMTDETPQDVTFGGTQYPASQRIKIAPQRAEGKHRRQG